MNKYANHDVGTGRAHGVESLKEVFPPDEHEGFCSVPAWSRKNSSPDGSIQETPAILLT